MPDRFRTYFGLLLFFSLFLGLSGCAQLSRIAGTDTVSGRVIDAETSQGIAGVRLTLEDEDGNVKETVSEQGGMYSFSGVEPGEIIVTVHDVIPVNPDDGQHRVVKSEHVPIVNLDLFVRDTTDDSGLVAVGPGGNSGSGDGDRKIVTCVALPGVNYEGANRIIDIPVWLTRTMPLTITSADLKVDASMSISAISPTVSQVVNTYSTLNVLPTTYGGAEIDLTVQSKSGQAVTIPTFQAAQPDIFKGTISPGVPHLSFIRTRIPKNVAGEIYLTFSGTATSGSTTRNIVNGGGCVDIKIPTRGELDYVIQRPISEDLLKDDDLIIDFELEQSTTIRFDVVDAEGRLVRTYPGIRREAGAYRAVWDGLNDDERPASSGTYIGRLQLGEQRVSVPLTVRR